MTVTSGSRELTGETHPTPRLAQRRRSHRPVLGLAAAVLSEDDARHLAEAGQREQEAGVGLARPGAVERHDVACGIPQQPAYAGSFLAS